MLKTYVKNNHLNIDELIKFHLVFDEFDLKTEYYDVFLAIDKEILSNLEFVLSYFANFTDAEKTALENIAKSDRKWLNLYKILPFSTAGKTYAKLLQSGVLMLEKSRETPPKKLKNQKLKRAEKRYKIENKVYFSNHFYRFFFRFIQPNLEKIKCGKKDEVLAQIKDEFDEYASLGFERICAEYLRLKFGINSEISSFWKGKIEIDLLLNLNGLLIVGEVKYKNKKVCKNILNLLLRKCEILKIKPDLLFLFSKSGFSKELINLNDDRIRLVALEEFEEVLNG